MEDKIKRYDGQEITINIPFTYIIGEVGYHSGRTLETIEDCKNEVMLKINEPDNEGFKVSYNNLWIKQNKKQ
jgi:hypothetical protein